MSATQQIPGDVQIKTVSIYADKGVVNATEIVVMMSIYESILTPGIIVELGITDARNMITELPILGGEKVVIELAAPGRKDRRLELVIASITDSTTSINERVKSYKIEAVSEEIIIDKTVQVCKSYNTNISSMVTDILTQFLKTKKKIDVQNTRGVQKFLVPSERPFDAVKMLRRRSVSVDDKSSMYVFFENADGFHYKTIEKLFADGQVGDRVFNNDPTLHTDITKSDFRNIISYVQPNQFDLTSRLRTGGMAHQVNKFDIKTLDYKTKTVKFNPGEYKSADGTFKSPDDSKTVTKYGNGAGSDSWVINDSGNPDTFISDGLGARQNMAALMGQGFLHLHVFGDSELTAGQTINLNIVDNNASTTEPKLHPQLSGKYVIAFIRHIITAEGTMPRYTCSIEALKGGYKGTA
jgi:hypothetical protein